MSEEIQEQPQISPGLLLKTAREALNLSTQNIADRLCLKNSMVIDIENDIYDQNISLTFIKGYLKSYAKFVGVQEQTVISAFDELKTQKKEPAKLQSFSKRLAHQAHDDKLMLVTYLIVALVIALVVIWWLQQSESTSASTPVKAQVNTSTGDNTSTKIPFTNDSVMSALASEPEPEPSPQVETNLQTANEFDTQAPSISEEKGEEPETQADFELSPSRQQSLTEEVLPLAEVEVVFTFKSQCWMKLTDSTGEDVAYGTKAKDRVMTVSGVPPFSVILCAPEAADILFAGQTVDLSGMRAGSTAKFTLPITE